MTWDATGHETSTVSLVLCRGPGSNCVNDPDAIVEKIPASAESYAWAVPCSLPAGKQQTATGYGMLIIEDGTGIFQYSTQFSVLENPQCGGSDSSTTSAGTTTDLLPTGAHNGTYGKPTDTESATTITTIKPTTKVAPTEIPTGVPVASTTDSIVWSTATQASTTASRPAVATDISGADTRKNAAGALFLGAVGAAFLL